MNFDSGYTLIYLLDSVRVTAEFHEFNSLLVQCFCVQLRHEFRLSSVNRSKWASKLTITPTMLNFIREVRVWNLAEVPIIQIIS
jgi:hypothetical protein